jgi:type I restriction enzyme M protein
MVMAARKRTNTTKVTNGKSTRPAAVAGEPLDIAPGDKLTRDKLERYLWSAADILRGSIDSSDYKNYIFGLLFLKRLSDRFDEECDALVAEGADIEDPKLLIDGELMLFDRVVATPPFSLDEWGREVA